MKIITEEYRYTILRWDEENSDFNWYLSGTDDYTQAVEEARSSAKWSNLSTDLIGIRHNETKEIVALALKVSPEDLPISIVQIYELKG